MALACFSMGACGTLGSEPAPPGPLPHNGTGPYRPLEPPETGLFGVEPSCVLLALGRDVAVDRAMMAAGHLWLGMARLRPDAPPLEGPAHDVDWTAFEPRFIARARSNGAGGFVEPEVVLMPDGDEGYVTDPWMLVHPDGTLRMYYASALGIRVAESAGPGGPFVRREPATVAAAENGPLRRPTAVRFGEQTLLWFESPEGIRLVRAEDGVRFGPATPLEAGVETDAGLDDARLESPGATVVHTTAGRSFVRLFVEARRPEGPVELRLLATDDGHRYEAYSLPVLDVPDATAPAPLALDARRTLLVFRWPRVIDGRWTGAVCGAIAPASARWP
ncbi:MAG: hypothetical protein NZ898_00295 [Myxococcota bacterium]|nr:hypothetical protein [Myxococcota bacterium]MDW8361984.1 hypothetical protein [Myxococcales bacterium]